MGALARDMLNRDVKARVCVKPVQYRWRPARRRLVRPLTASFPRAGTSVPVERNLRCKESAMTGAELWRAQERPGVLEPPALIVPNTPDVTRRQGQATFPGDNMRISEPQDSRFRQPSRPPDRTAAHRAATLPGCVTTAVRASLLERRPYRRSDGAHVRRAGAPVRPGTSTATAPDVPRSLSRHEVALRSSLVMSTLPTPLGRVIRPVVFYPAKPLVISRRINTANGRVGAAM